MAMISNMTMTQSLMTQTLMTQGLMTQGVMPGPLPAAMPILPPQPRAWEIAAGVPDPRQPRETIADAGILHDVVAYDQGDVHVQISSGQLPRTVVDTVRDLLVQALLEQGFRRVDVECCHR